MSIRATQFYFVSGPALIAAFLAGCATPTERRSAPIPHYLLNAAQTWQLNLPGGERFDASGLFLAPNGDLLTVNDRAPAVYRIQLVPGLSAADLVELPDCFTPAQLAAFAGEKTDRYDIEGITEDTRRRIYLCEEANRWILRFDPRLHTVERLKIDWAPVEKYFSPVDRNASFEGIAIGDGKLYVANERERGRIIVVDLATLKVLDDFEVRSRVASLWGPHYSDLCWFRGELYVLMREDRVVLRVNPHSHQVLAEYDFSKMESAPENKYRKLYWLAGVMEGLAVDENNFWLVTDNNGLGRESDPNDRRPTLFRCPRPEGVNTNIFNCILSLQRGLVFSSRPR
jgi:hypothetical protein